MSSLQNVVKKLFLKNQFNKELPNFEEAFPEVGFLINEHKDRFEKLIKYKIKNVNIFEQALTHRSYLRVVKDKKVYSNERLEFLGDSILNMIIAEFLFSEYNSQGEGKLTTLRSRIVNEKSLILVAEKLELSKFINFSFATKKLVTIEKGAALADAVEAIIAAIYIDSNLQNAKKFVYNIVIPTLSEFSVIEEDVNYKSKLLEHFQALRQDRPQYETIEEIGPDHDRQFKVGVFQANELLANGIGNSKKKAEQDAAKNAIIKLKL
jgi:ribonuclease-3